MSGESSRLDLERHKDTMGVKAMGTGDSTQEIVQ